MKYFDAKKLNKLLTEYAGDLNIDKCRSHLNEYGLENYDVGEKISINESIEVYERRFELSQDTGNFIEGLSELVINLKNYSGDYVKIHSFGKLNNLFVIFTDKQVREIIGIMSVEASNECIEETSRKQAKG